MREMRHLKAAIGLITDQRSFLSLFPTRDCKCGGRKMLVCSVTLSKQRLERLGNSVVAGSRTHMPILAVSTLTSMYMHILSTWWSTVHCPHAVQHQLIAISTHHYEIRAHFGKLCTAHIFTVSVNVLVYI